LPYHVVPWNQGRNHVQSCGCPADIHKNLKITIENIFLPHLQIKFSHLWEKGTPL
jgi:hypothetical protein